MRPGVALTLAGFCLLLGGCGRGDVAATKPSTNTSGRPYSPLYWYDAAYDGSNQRVRLTFDGPSGSGCEEDRGVAVEKDEYGAVVVSVRSYEPHVPASCPVSEQSIVADLGAPLGDRRLRKQSDQTAFHDENGRLVLIPETTPCGRADCSSPSPTPAACNNAVYADATTREIDGGMATTDERCDGSFLVMTIVNNSACLPEQYGKSCSSAQKAFFVANAAQWKLVLLARGAACPDVWRTSRIQFPAALCG